MAKKWPEMVVKRSYIKGHSFPYRLYFKSLPSLPMPLPVMYHISPESLPGLF